MAKVDKVFNWIAYWKLFVIIIKLLPLFYYVEYYVEKHKKLKQNLNFCKCLSNDVQTPPQWIAFKKGFTAGFNNKIHEL